ncbi:MAG TPA: serine/threonine protein kinase [Xanthobacteraceae bacterium]|jgi:hypothetical protein|nr:serine/threonine protein kinase [Xanthobacteraceae bacterium]
MDAPYQIPAELDGQWSSTVVLKRDVFSTIERGFFSGPNGKIDAVLRRIDHVPWWTQLIARHFLRREARALQKVGKLGVAPSLLFQGRRVLVRGFIDGVALHIARPVGDLAYFRSAKQALRALHRAGLSHNDLAKEQNWLRSPDGRAFLTDFQLAFCYKKRSALFRIAAYEDLRHLLKHKRSYVPDALTPAERKVLSRKSLPTRIWMATGKRVYIWITRGVIGFTDREGGGPRLVNDAPIIISAIKKHQQVSDAAVVAFADRRSGTGLYAFIETSGPLSKDEIRQFTAQLPADIKAPEHLQIVRALPRNADGKVRTEILQLIAMNQVDLIAPLIRSDSERLIIDEVLAGRQNLRDRFSF